MIQGQVVCFCNPVQVGPALVAYVGYHETFVRADRPRDIEVIGRVLRAYPDHRALRVRDETNVQLSFPFMLDPRGKLGTLYVKA